MSEDVFSALDKFQMIRHAFVLAGNGQRPLQQQAGPRCRCTRNPLPAGPSDNSPRRPFAPSAALACAHRFDLRFCARTASSAAFGVTRVGAPANGFPAHGFVTRAITSVLFFGALVTSSGLFTAVV